MRKQWHRDSCAAGQTASKCQGQGSNPGHLALELLLLATKSQVWNKTNESCFLFFVFFTQTMIVAASCGRSGRHLDNLPLKRSVKVQMIRHWAKERWLAKHYKLTTNPLHGTKQTPGRPSTLFPKNRPRALTLGLELWGLDPVSS